MELSDDDIIRRVQAGHTRDYSILVRRYQAGLVRFLSHFVGDSDEAETIAQEAFVRVYASLPKYTPQGRFKSFLFTSARNLGINFIKQRKRSMPMSEVFSPGREAEHLRSDDTPDLSLERDLRQARLDMALRRLSHNQRLALVLKVYMQYSYKQIREVTGWSVAKIETLISRARSNLIRLIEMQDQRSPTVTQMEIANELQKNS